MPLPLSSIVATMSGGRGWDDWVPQFTPIRLLSALLDPQLQKKKHHISRR
jgi:hypothetical protein